MTDRELLDAARRPTGLSQARFAVEVLGVSDQSVSDWATGRTRMQEPTRRLLHLLAAHPQLADALRAMSPSPNE